MKTILNEVRFKAFEVVKLNLENPVMQKSDFDSKLRMEHLLDNAQHHSDLTEQKEEMYARAYFLYGQARYAEACSLFILLTSQFDLEARYWRGLGACFQMQHHYEEALRCYACVEELKKEKVDLHLQINIADCLFALKQIEKGLTLLESMRIEAEKQREMRILEHIVLMQHMWARS